MKHIIIGVAQAGAEALSHVYPLFYKATQDSINRDVAFFYIHDRTQGKSDLKFIIPQHSYSLPEGTDATIVNKIDARLKQSIACPEKLADLTPKDIKTSLSFIKEQFAKYGDEFWSSVAAFCRESQDREGTEHFHIMLDASDTFSAGMTFNLFDQLQEQYPFAMISVYAFYPSGEKILSEKNAAVLASVLLRLSELHSEHFLPYVFSFKSTTQQVAHMMACGKQIFSSIYLAPATMGIEKIAQEDRNHQFHQIKELMVRVDYEKIGLSLSQQIVSLLMKRLLSGGKKEEINQENKVSEGVVRKTMPSILSLASDYGEIAPVQTLAPKEEVEDNSPKWTNELFSDKRWFLHPDYLMMEQDIFPRPGQEQWLPVEEEWRVQANIALEKTSSVRGWANRFQAAREHLESFYQNDFREQGASVFYTVNDRSLAAVAKLITAQIEEELIIGWQRGDYEIVHISSFLEKVIRLLNARLALCRGLLEEYSFNIDGSIHDFEALIEEWTEGTRAERKQIEKTDDQNVIQLLAQYYTAQCQNMAMNFANKLLWTIIEEINLLQEQLKLSIEETKEYIQRQSEKKSDTECHVNLSVVNEQEWVVFSDADFLSLMPDSFAKQTDSVFEIVRDDFAKLVRAKKGLTALLRILQENELIENLNNLVLREHPIFHAARLSALNNLVFWRTVPTFLINPPEIFNQELHTFSAIDDSQDDVNNKGLWLVPSAPFDREALDPIISALRIYSPSSHVLINVRMNEPYLIFRNVSSYSLNSLPGFDLIRKGYEKTLSGSKGTINALLLHPENSMPYPARLDNLLRLPPIDDIRRILLLAEVYGVLQERQTEEGKAEIYSSMHGNEMVFGPSFLEIIKTITSSQTHYLTCAVDCTSGVVITEEHHLILQRRLSKIKDFCLNGKNDIREASWKEAGLYMPWSRAAERILPSLGATCGMNEHESKSGE